MWLFVFEMHLISGVTDGGGCETDAGVRTAPPWKAKCKNQAPTELVFWYLLFVWLSVSFFLRFSECFPVISGFSTANQIRIHCYFSTFFTVLGWPVGSLQLVSPLALADKSYI